MCVAKPLQVDLLRAVHKITADAVFTGQLPQSLSIGTGAAANDQGDVRLRQRRSQCLLPVLRCVANVIFVRQAKEREAEPESCNHRFRFVEAQSGLREHCDLLRIGHLHGRDLFQRFDDLDRLGSLSLNPDHFIVPAMADQDDTVAFLLEASGFQVNLHHQWTSRVNDSEVASARLAIDFRSYSVRTEYDYSVVRYLLDVIDEYHAPRP